MSNRSTRSLLSFSEIRRDAQRLAYYCRGTQILLTPRALRYKQHKNHLLALQSHAKREKIKKNIAYYMKRGAPFDLPSMQLKDLPIKRSRYYIDFVKYARGLPKDARFDLIFSDVTHVPDTPTIVKSRPIAGCNENSVLFPLNVLRHYYDYPDPYTFREKSDSAVWRGNLNNPQRHALVTTYTDSPLHNIGIIKSNKSGLYPKAYLSPEAQLRHKFILSIEGVDVATNLKWAMASNSLVLSPPLKFETWYREGQLIPGIHFVELKPDFSDLDEKCAFYSKNQDAAQEIIKAAQTWRNSFRNKNEQAITASGVLNKYLQLSGQAHI